MSYQIKLPDGSLAWIADDVPNSKALELAKKAYPDAFPETPSIGSQLLSAPKEFIKSAASGVVQSIGGLGALPYAGARYISPELPPFEKTGFGKAITGTEQYLAPSDEGVITQVAGGLGSVASMIGPQFALRGLGAAGRFAGVAPRAAMPVRVAQTAGLGAEEARQQVEIARGDKIDVTPGQELEALAIGVPIGFTELLPVEKLFRGLDKTLSGDVKLTISNYIKRGLAQGGIEGAQEAASRLMQDLSAKGIYDSNIDVGSSMLHDAMLGGGVGFLAQTGLDFLLRKDIGRAYQAKLANDKQRELNKKIDAYQQEIDKQTIQKNKNLNVSDPNLLLLPPPSPEVEHQGKPDPLMNPLGFFKEGELSPEYLKAVNDIRKKEGKQSISQFSIEDLADAGAPQQEVDRLLAAKTGFTGETRLSSDDVLNVASKKNIDTSTVGFLDFLRRTTGAENLNKMSQPQLFSAFKALDALAPSDKLQVLPPGTNSTRFSTEQYDKAIEKLTSVFPEDNMMSRDEIIKNIKKVAGLKNNRDAESILQTAILKDDLTTVNREVYETGKKGDMTSPAINVYTNREEAEREAARRDLDIRERTHQYIALPGKATQLPGGPDIRKGTFEKGVEPAEYEIRFPDGIKLTAPSIEEANAKADRVQAIRTKKSGDLLKQISEKQQSMKKDQFDLENMESEGKSDTLEYKKKSAEVSVKTKKLQDEIDNLKAQVQFLTDSPNISPKGQKPITENGFTLFEQNKPISTFQTQEAAEEFAIMRLPDNILQDIVNLAPEQKGLMPKRLGVLANKEIARRSGKGPSGIGIEYTGKKEDVEKRLAEIGIFTPQFQKQVNELDKKLRPIMNRLGLGDLRLNIVRAIKTPEGQEANGSYVRGLIEIALNADNPMRALRHEGIHALKELGAFTKDQWRVLENKAKSEWMSKYDIQNRYSGLSMDEMIEEAIADAFSDFSTTKAPPGLIGALFNKIKTFFDALGNALRGMGFQTAEDIFQATEEGRLRTIPKEEIKPVEPSIHIWGDTGEQPVEQPVEVAPSQEVLTAKPKFSLKQTNTPEFKQWFGKSKAVNKDGTPKVYYHGTAQNIAEFKPKQAGAIFLTDDPNFAEQFSDYSADWMSKHSKQLLSPEHEAELREKLAKLKKDNPKDWGDKIDQFAKEFVLDKLNTGENIMPLYVRAENPFDYENSKHLQKIKENLTYPDDWMDSLKDGDWSSIESDEVQNAIKAAGFDSFYVEEGGRKNLAVYDPNQVKSAIGNIGTFSRESKDIRYSIREQLGQDTVDAIDRTTKKREVKGFSDRISEAMSPTSFAKFRQGYINKYESIEKLSHAVSKVFGSKELMADTSAIAAALLSDRAAGVAASSYKNGIPVYRKGFTTVSNENGKVKGLIPILEPLMELNDPFAFQAFQFYAATRRGRRLDQEQRENLFTQDDLRRGETVGKMFPVFKTVFDEYQKYNKGLVDFMRDTGVISEKEAEIWTENWDYIPFYRQMDGEKTLGPNIFSSIAGVSKPKKLKGGEAPLDDFMETIIRNSRAAIESGMKNVAAQKVMRDVLRMNQGELVRPSQAVGDDIVTVKENGVTKHYRVDDPLLVESLKGLNLPQLPFLEILAKPAEVLRNLVTKDPGFMMANLMRDSIQSWVTSGTDMKPLVDTFKQYASTLANRSPEAQALANAGLFAGYDFGSDTKSSARAVEAALRKRTGKLTTKEKAILPLTKIWDMLDQGSAASDVATRAEIYKRTLAETGNEAEALYQAMEVLNFSRKGNSALIRVLSAMVPFMNARIQGLDVLYRSGFGKMATQNKERMQKAFISRSMTLFALSWMYWMLASDTDEYKTAEQETRDNNWIIGNVRIPIPFEIGTVFKVMPERILEYFLGSDTSKDLKESIVRNITSTLAFNPIPQAFLPVVENMANYSFFTGKPIVGRGMEDVAKPYQVAPSTSLLAKKISEITEPFLYDKLQQSPIQIDHLIRGYTGTLGTYAVMALDSIFRGEGSPTRATLKAEQMPVVKRFFASEEGTGTVSAYYELKKNVDESVRTINFLERTGNIDDLREYMKEKGIKLQAIKPYIQTLDKEMTRLHDMKRMIQSSNMNPDDKRDVLSKIHTAEVKLTSGIQRIKNFID